MTARPDDLPEFEDPPVVEVLLAVRFEPLERLVTPYFGVLWEEYFSDQFPTMKERPRHEPPDERFDVREPGVQFIVEDMPAPRVWFLSEKETELLQLQSNWFARNWRKTDAEREYPRYETIRESFERDFETLASFVAEKDLGNVVPNQCEVTYINHIVPNEMWSTHSELSRVLRFVSDIQVDDDRFLPELEDARLQMRYPLRDEHEDGKPLGRLHVSVQPGFETATSTPILRLTLTARGRPRGQSLDDLLRFYDLGRQWIVRGFTELTTDGMHRAWSRVT